MTTVERKKPLSWLTEGLKGSSDLGPIEGRIQGKTLTAPSIHSTHISLGDEYFYIANIVHSPPFLSFNR